MFRRVLLAASVLACATLSATEPSSYRVLDTTVDRLHALGVVSDAEQYGNQVWLRASAAQVRAIEQAGLRVLPAGTDTRVRINGFVFDPQVEVPAPARVAAAKTASGNTLAFVQFDRPLKPVWSQQLAQAGLRVIQYYPDHTVLVFGSTAALSQARTQIPQVRATGGFAPVFKLAPSLAGRSGRINHVEAQYVPSADSADLLEQLRALGARILWDEKAQPDGAIRGVVMEIDADKLDQVATRADVLHVSYYSVTPQLEDEASNQIIAPELTGTPAAPVVGYAGSLAALGLDGSGVQWAITDTGVDLTHPDLVSRVYGGFSFPGCASTGGNDTADGGHGTHVAGTVAGAGIGDGAGPAAEVDANGFLYGQGVAPNARLFAISALCGQNTFQDRVRQAVIGGAIGTNNSWFTGNSNGAPYTAITRTHDILVRDGNWDTPALDPFIIVFSAGNSGPNPSTLTEPKSAKNVITVANSLNIRAGNIGNIASSSSRGPTQDGRIAPTVAAPGSQIASTKRVAGASQCATSIAGTANLYAFCTGTSMAAPHVSGTAALIVEWWRDRNAGATPSPAMVKAILVNGATDMVGTGLEPANPGPIPNNNEGWGRVNHRAMLASTVLGEYRDQQTLFANTGDVYELPVVVADTTQPLKVTLTWSDAPGAANANPALINNLDLEVVNGANTFLGNRFTAGWSVTGGAADNRDTTENVFVRNPAGSATIRVRATALNGDALAGNGNPSNPRQDFALVCTNCQSVPDYTLAATPARAEMCTLTQTSQEYAVDIGSVLGYVMPVDLAVEQVPTGAQATLGANQVTPPGATTVTLSALDQLAAGSYTAQLQATSMSGPKQVSLGFDLYSAIPAFATLSEPADQATGIGVQPTFRWTAVEQAQSYTIDLATDAAFTEIVVTATVDQTEYTPAAPLNASTPYYWRVRANNLCGDGLYTEAFSFTTAAIFCRAPNLAITDNATVSDTMTIPQQATIADVDVRVELTHTYVGDLRVFLQPPSGAQIALIDRPRANTASCSGDDIVADFDQSATTPANTACNNANVPTLAGALQPFQTLAPTAGQQLIAGWRLVVTDAAGGDVGMLTRWCLTPTLRDDSIYGHGFELMTPPPPPGN